MYQLPSELVVRYTVHDPPFDDGSSILLTKSIKDGFVYEGSLTHAKSDSLDVVVKFFQNKRMEEVPAAQPMTKEALAYKKLFELQGSIIPVSYGFHVFQLQNDVVFGHVMQKIEGQEIVQEPMQQLQLKSVYDLADAIALALDTIHTYGVLHGDVRGPNIRATKNNHAVIYDFDRSGEIKSKKETAFDGARIGDIFESAGIARAIVYNWYLTRAKRFKCLEHVIAIPPMTPEMKALIEQEEGQGVMW